MLVHDDAEHDAVEPGDDAAIEFRCARVDCHGMALGRITDRLDASIEQNLEQAAPRL